MTKRRLSATVERELITAAEQAVANGLAPTLSAWVNDALRMKLERDRRLTCLAEFVADYEAKHGEISAEEMREAARGARARAMTVRSLGPRRRTRQVRR